VWALVFVAHTAYSDIQPSGPYGGYKQSGYGRLGGIEGLDEFSQVKNTRITFNSP
jgi:acyl-CoA reductase-like NAD-dependent aldehyde dehydrogenase